MSEPTRATVGLKLQDNLGDFLLLTTHIEVTTDAFAERGETVDQLVERLYEFVSSKLVEKIIDARGKIEGLA